MHTKEKERKKKKKKREKKRKKKKKRKREKKKRRKEKKKEMLDLLKMFQTILKNKSHHCLEVSKTALQMLLSFKCRPHDLIRPF